MSDEIRVDGGAGIEGEGDAIADGSGDEPDEERDSREVFLEELCARRQYFLGLFSFAVIFLLLQFPYLFVLESDSTLFVVATMNVFGSGLFVVGFGSVLWVCSKRT